MVYQRNRPACRAARASRREEQTHLRILYRGPIPRAPLRIVAPEQNAKAEQCPYCRANAFTSP